MRMRSLLIEMRRPLRVNCWRASNLYGNCGEIRVFDISSDGATCFVESGDDCGSGSHVHSRTLTQSSSRKVAPQVAPESRTHFAGAFAGAAFAEVDSMK